MARPLAIFVPFLAFAAAAGAQTLVRDIGGPPTFNPSSVGAGEAISTGAHVYFAALDRQSGEELWRSDGTRAGTHLVADLVPGSGSSAPRPLASFGNQVFFTTAPFTRPWRTDGTAAGTVLLHGGLTVGNATPVLLGTRLVFTALLNGLGHELWITDGTPAGTALLLDINPGPNSSNPDTFVEWNGTVYFRAGVGGTRRLWRTDGTTAGTFEIVPVDVSSMAAAGPWLYFAKANELWRSDGTAAGTSLVRGGLVLSSLTALGNDVCFVANDGVNGSELWRSDGTAAGTFMVMDIYPGPTMPDFTGPRMLKAAGSTLFFLANEGVHGLELWASDGTTAGTRLVKDIWPGPDHSFPRYAFALGSRLYLVADDGSTGQELWTSDGTTLGTHLVKDCAAGTGNSYPSQFAALGTRLYFSADEGPFGTEPYLTDGTAAGTQLIADINSGFASSEPVYFTALGRSVVFRAHDASHGDEPWVSDGTAAGTTMLLDIAPGTASSLSGLYTYWNGRLWFTARDAAHGQEVWSTDGTTAGTTLALDLEPGPVGSQPQALVPFGDRLIVIASTTADGNELFVTDGTPAGTQVIDLFPNGSSNPAQCVVAGARFFFVARDPVFGGELWCSDGTVAGTRRITDLVPGTGSPVIGSLTAVGARVFFAGATQISFPVFNDIEPWVSDGTPGGTYQVADIVPGIGSSSPAAFVAWRGEAWFLTTAQWLGNQLWRSDGTAAGTTQVAANLEVQLFGGTSPLVLAHDRLFFASAGELWSSDGTPAGTALVRDIRPGPGPSNPVGMIAAGSGRTVVFAADDGVSGMEPWVSDGTASGTRLAADIWPLEYPSRPTWFARAGPTLFFAADDGVSGIEPFAMPLAAIGASLAAPFALACPGSTGAPSIGARGLPTLGSTTFGFTLANARPSAPTWLVLSAGLHPGADRLPCIHALPFPTIAVGTMATAAGTAQILTGVPQDASLLGGELFAQWLTADPTGGFLGIASLSDILDVVIGN